MVKNTLLDLQKVSSDILMEFSVFPDTSSGFELAINEKTETKEESYFEIGLLKSVDEFIKKNPSTKEVTSPMFFSRPGYPDPDGLLSNEIFGLTKQERSGIFGYISLNDWFIHPLCYKKLIRLNVKFRDIIHGTKKFIINENGELIQSENGNTGLTWLKKNIDTIKLAKENMSDKREKLVEFIEKNKKTMWLNKYLVIPAFYRDVDSKDSGKVAVGEINELYSSLIITCRGIKETADYGFGSTDAIKGRAQEIILAIYDLLIGNNNSLTSGANGISKKSGIWKRAGESKTTNYGSRLVLSAPNLAVEYLDDIMVDIKHVGVPLASLCANVYPFMVHWLRSFFDNEFGNGTTIDVVKKDGKLVHAHCKDPYIQFSDERIKEELKRFIEGWGDRLRPIMIETEEFKEPLAYRFRAENYDPKDPRPDTSLGGESKIVNRRMTWCDLFFIAANEVCQDKCILITRYPIDSCYNQFPAYIVVKSTIKTEPIYYRGKFYRYFPSFTDEEIGSDTSNKFSDTLWISNLILKSIGGDYDGDTTSQKVVFTREANDELTQYIESKANVIGFNGQCYKTTTNESIQAIFNLTRVLPDCDITPEDQIE